jgi:oxygen-independent coproporphyrinogen III oxidase
MPTRDGQTTGKRFATADYRNAAEATEHSDSADDSALGLYISFPFCRSKCTYCNFASGVYPAAEHARYVDRAIADMAGAAGWAAKVGAHLPRRVDTIYLGGGTPSLLEPELIARLFAAIRAEFRVDPDAEITMECAPGLISDETLAAMVAASVRRVSLGVQSFVDREAAVTGRLHNRSTVMRDIARLRTAGIESLSVDLIAGLPGQTLESWSESLEALVACGVPHASIYMLEVDDDSRLGREMLAGGTRYHAGLAPTDDAIARMYAAAIARLAAAGLEQYEISNFARAGFASRHNLRYWRRRPYLGVGLDASSALRAAAGGDREGHLLRSATTSDLRAYLDGDSQPEIGWLSMEQQHEEAWFLGLRLNAGVEIAAIEREFGAALAAEALATVRRFAESGLVRVEREVVRLTPRGRLLSNEVFQEFIGLKPAYA